MSSKHEAKSSLFSVISMNHLDFEVFDLLKITVFQAMMRIASRQCFQKNGDFVYSSGFCKGVHSPLSYVHTHVSIIQIPSQG
jgi:hypothetical protein